MGYGVQSLFIASNQTSHGGLTSLSMASVERCAVAFNAAAKDGAVIVTSLNRTHHVDLYVTVAPNTNVRGESRFPIGSNVLRRYSPTWPTC